MICPCCYMPVNGSDSVQLSYNGPLFHRSCITPGNYHVKLERFKRRFYDSVPADLRAIQSDMERAFGIPVVLDDRFVSINPEVVALYRLVNDSRIL